MNPFEGQNSHEPKTSHTPEVQSLCRSHAFRKTLILNDFKEAQSRTRENLFLYWQLPSAQRFSRSGPSTGGITLAGGSCVPSAPPTPSPRAGDYPGELFADRIPHSSAGPPEPRKIELLPFTALHPRPVPTHVRINSPPAAAGAERWRRRRRPRPSGARRARAEGLPGLGHLAGGPRSAYSA